MHVNLASREYYDSLPDATICFATVKQKNQSMVVVSVSYLREELYHTAHYKYCTAIGTNILLLPEKRRPDIYEYIY